MSRGSGYRGSSQGGAWVGEVRTANASSHSIRMPMRKGGVSPSSSPTMVRAGQADWKGMVPTGVQTQQAIGRNLGTAVDKRQAGLDSARAEAMQAHPSMQSAASASGGNPVGQVKDTPAADKYYKAPTGMGAQVPPSRSSKFAQGRGV